MENINAALAELSALIAAKLQAKDDEIASLRAERDSLLAALGNVLHEADVLAGIAAVAAQVASVDTSPDPLPNQE